MEPDDDELSRLRLFRYKGGRELKVKDIGRSQQLLFQNLRHRNDRSGKIMRKRVYSLTCPYSFVSRPDVSHRSVQGRAKPKTLLYYHFLFFLASTFILITRI